MSVLRRGEPSGTCVPHRSPRACSGRCCARNGRGASRARPAKCGMRHAQQNPHHAALHGNTRRVNMPCGIQRTAWNAQCARRRPASPPYRPHRPDRQTRAAPVAWLRSKGDAVGSATQCSRQSRSSVEGSRRNGTRGTSGYSEHRVPWAVRTAGTAARQLGQTWLSATAVPLRCAGTESPAWPWAVGGTSDACAQTARVTRCNPKVRVASRRIERADAAAAALAARSASSRRCRHCLCRTRSHAAQARTCSVCTRRSTDGLLQL